MEWLLWLLAIFGGLVILLIIVVVIVVVFWGDELFVAAVQGFFKDLTGG